MAKKLLAEIRKAVADYMYSEGCNCCRNVEEHDEARERLGKLLRIPKKDDWRDFYKYRSTSTGSTRR